MFTEQPTDPPDLHPSSAATTMRAVVQRDYGPPKALRLSTIAMPRCEAHEVLLAVRASSVNPYDWHFITGLPYLARLLGRGMGMGVRGPLSPVRGFDVAGVVIAVGDGVRRWQPGDEVFGWCDGAFADFVAVDGKALVRKPSTLTFEQAGAVAMAGLTALQAVRDKGRVERGQRVLVTSASGGVGTFAVQLAKAFGAEVTGVCSSRNVELVRTIGADQVIDYTREDFTAGKQTYDLIIDSALSHTLSQCRRVLAADGTHVVFGNSGGSVIGGFRRIMQAQLTGRLTRHHVRTFTVAPNLSDLQVLQQFMADGLVTPVLDRSYPLSQIVDAMDYLEQGHARGKIVLVP